MLGAFSTTTSVKLGPGFFTLGKISRVSVQDKLFTEKGTKKLNFLGLFIV